MARLRKLLGAFCVVAVTGAVGASASHALFDGDTSIPDNTVTAGTVAISDNDNGSAMFNLPALKPSDPPATGCTQVRYDGDVDAVVHLYGSTTGALALHVSVKIERGGTCGSFTPDSTNYIGQGPGVVFDGTLAGLPGSFDSGIVDPPSGGPETWAPGEVHAYRFTVSLANVPAAQGLSSQSSFTWEARDQ